MPSESKAVAAEIPDTPSNLIGDHPTIVKLRAVIERVACSDATVLISGESGTGKEVVARMIHAASPRRERPFVPVNCAAIPTELLESELFGHGRGAARAARVNVRVLAASNSDLGALVAKGAFRRDLFYRLEVVPIIIPPLRERRSDIPNLIEHFLDRMNLRGRKLAMSREAMVRLWSYQWPGNVRELENVVERLTVLCEGR